MTQVYLQCAAMMAVTLGWSAKGYKLMPAECVTTTVFPQALATELTTASPFQSKPRDSRSSASSAQVLSMTMQTSGSGAIQRSVTSLSAMRVLLSHC